MYGFQPLGGTKQVITKHFTLIIQMRRLLANRSINYPLMASSVHATRKWVSEIRTGRHFICVLSKIFIPNRRGLPIGSQLSCPSACGHRIIRPLRHPRFARRWYPRRARHLRRDSAVGNTGESGHYPWTLDHASSHALIIMHSIRKTQN